MPSFQFIQIFGSVCPTNNKLDYLWKVKYAYEKQNCVKKSA